jgi:nitrite reductase/ring-hydroxylating ferredoxin subunit
LRLPARVRDQRIAQCSPDTTLADVAKSLSFAGEAVASSIAFGGVSPVPVRIASSKDVKAGQMRVFDVAGTRVTLASAGNHFYAFDDTCTHMGCSLANGHLAGTVVTCACHGSQFDVTSGAVLRGPAQRPVRSRAVHVQGDDLLVDE